MALVGYGSSDEDDDDEEVSTLSSKPEKSSITTNGQDVDARFEPSFRSETGHCGSWYASIYPYQLRSLTSRIAE
jgi:hypothetical protein